MAIPNKTIFKLSRILSAGALVVSTYVDWDGLRLKLTGPARLDLNSLPSRYSLRWMAGQRGKPGINADIQNAAEAVRMIADPDFEVLGVNAVSADTAFNAEGGITLSSHGADLDSTILLPHLDANQSGWAQITWGTDQETEWECDFTLSQITACVFWAGLKLTNTDVAATDDDQVFLRFQNGVNSGKFQVISSIAGTDTTTDTGVTAALAGRYHVKVAIDSSRKASVWLNGVRIVTTAALTNAVDLIPYIGIKASGAAAVKSVVAHGQTISRLAV